MRDGKRDGRMGSAISSVDSRMVADRALFLAEGEGVEPPVPFRVQWFSRPPPSTTRPSLPPSQAYITPLASAGRPAGAQAYITPLASAGQARSAANAR